ncbi:hypothetical protein L6452_03892 [Arctium lappa]|uniref:Uncharacterized protein n=1 Tax=Arctium lappa TaxID=4217 RepID=A0ACB9FPF0_ARCLA|nr:hypothetical protein L6452_03892 [Arctium lappa]
MSLPILQMRLSIPTPASSNLSFSSHIVSDPTRLFLTSSFSHLSIAKSPKSTTIRMGGGPRTYPGGVSKWQWKRMQAKKAKQLLRARLARERQVYEMRKRAELSAAVSELERPWEIVETAPKLFSASADEQLKVLADRFQKPGGFDLWSEKDGPQLFDTVDGVPSARFFPKGVVHSIKPYGRISDDGCSHEESDLVQRDIRDENSREIKNNDSGVGYRFWDKDSSLDSGLIQRKGNNKNSRNTNGRRIKGVGYQVCDQDLDPESGLIQRHFHEENPRNANGKFMKNDGRRRIPNSGGENGSNWRNGRKEHSSASNSGVFDMSLQDDGSLWDFEKGNGYQENETEKRK